MNIIFNSVDDAVSVAEQLYNVERIDNILIAQDIDLKALKLAARLVDIKLPSFNFPIVTELKCLLPFPEHERECIDDETPKIYVACLSAYNDSYLHGLWIDATQEPDDILDDIKWMLSWSPVIYTEPCEEWAIHDYECWEGIKLSEYEDIETVSELAQLLKEYGTAYAVYYQHYGSYYSTEEDFQNRYLGEYEDEEDFVYRMWESNGMIQQLEEINIPTFYIDWKAIARDWFINDYFSIKASHKETYIFIS
ncbi:MAG: antirestriction protein ArdA [Cyanobacteria bacterium P01_H01_bin.150]